MDNFIATLRNNNAGFINPLADKVATTAASTAKEEPTTKADFSQLLEVLKNNGAKTVDQGVSAESQYDNGAGFFNPLAAKVEEGVDIGLGTPYANGIAGQVEQPVTKVKEEVKVSEPEMSFAERAKNELVNKFNEGFKGFSGTDWDNERMSQAIKDYNDNKMTDDVATVLNYIINSDMIDENNFAHRAYKKVVQEVLDKYDKSKTASEASKAGETKVTEEKKSEPEKSSEEIEYTYKDGDTFGQVLLNLGLSDPTGKNLWGPGGDVEYYTNQLHNQGIWGNVPIGQTIKLQKRPTTNIPTAPDTGAVR